jgi:transcriptional regulator with XRE-family HTH domain
VSAIPDQSSFVPGILAVRVAESRREAGLTLDTLAERSGIARSYLTLIESGKPAANPGVVTVCTIAQALGVGPMYLLGWDFPTLFRRAPLAHIESNSEAVRLRPCPTCAAVKGSPCIQRNGSEHPVSQFVHVARFRDAGPRHAWHMPAANTDQLDNTSRHLSEAVHEAADSGRSQQDHG